jgi:hypothetical protein
VSYLEELRKAIRELHGVEAVHIRSVPVKEIFKNQVVWDGVVEVFDLINHPTAKMIYAWSHDTDDPNNPKRHVTVLHVHSIQSARDAVKATIVQEFKSLGKAEES